MLVLDLPPNIEQIIISNAHTEQLSVSDYILRHLPIQETPNIDSLTVAAGLMRGKMMDGSQYQEQIRAEWD